jgi:hypothetical protein
VGCGEGQLLSILSQPAPWLRPPPIGTIDQGSTASSEPTDDFSYFSPSVLHGLDISAEDLAFAVRDTAPAATDEASYNANFLSRYTSHSIRWEDFKVHIWKGALQKVNQEFVGIDCIVSTEVIEHLPPGVFPAFAPVLLGVYHPRLLLVTTPSYTFNARFTAPDAPKSTRKGYPDPTGRTDRIFRHDDHSFEWTVEEFETWCKSVAAEWGYEATTSSIGKAVENDPWGREGLGGASQVAVFRRSDSMSNPEREGKAKKLLSELDCADDEHELLASYHHSAHPSATKPKPLTEIAAAIREKMEEYKVSFIRLEEIWFEHDIAVTCGGYIEHLALAAEQSDYLALNRGDGMQKDRSAWSIELIGATQTPVLWPTEDGMSEAMTLPEDWIPEEDASADDTSPESSDWEEPTGNDDNYDDTWNDAEEDGGEESEGQVYCVDWGVIASLPPVHWTSDADDGWEATRRWLEDVSLDQTKGGEGAGGVLVGWAGKQIEGTC